MLDRSTFPVGSHRRADHTIRPTGWNYQKSYSPEGMKKARLHADLNRVITSFIVHDLAWQTCACLCGLSLPIHIRDVGVP